MELKIENGKLKKWKIDSRNQVRMICVLIEHSNFFEL